MADQDLDFIADPTAQATVRQMLAAVVDYPGIHRNLFKCQRQHDGTWEYFVGQHHSGPAAFPRYTRLPINVVDPLLLRGWAEVDRTPEFKGGWYRFTDQALEWYRRTSGPTDDQIRTALGRYFLRLEEHHPNDPQVFDAAAVARELGFEEPRVAAQTRFLVGVGVLEDIGPRGTGTPRLYRLARPDGFRWAATGFGPIANLRSMTVNLQVGVTIEVTQLLQDIAPLALPEAQKQEVAAVAQDLQQEPTVEKLGKLMALGADTITVVPAIARFLIQNGPALQHLLP